MTRERLREAGVPILVFVVGLGTILGALYSQFVLGYQPCPLCLQERMPYYWGLPVVALAVAIALAGVPSRWVRLVMAGAAVIFAISIYLGVNHAGIEWGFWPGPADCSSTNTLSEIRTPQDLINSLNGKIFVPCDKATWRFLGLSFAGWNAVMSVILTVAAAWAAAGGFSSQRITIVRKTPKASQQA